MMMLFSRVSRKIPLFPWISPGIRIRTTTECIRSSPYNTTHFKSQFRDSHHGSNAARERKSQRILIYLTAVAVAMVGGSYATVPLYRRFCQATGYGGTVQRRETVEEKIARHAQDGTAPKRELVVQFNADVADGMQWKFVPTQREVRVKPGESALAFYTAENLSSTPITGVSTYNVTPMKVWDDPDHWFIRSEIMCTIGDGHLVSHSKDLRFPCKDDFIKLPPPAVDTHLLLVSALIDQSSYTKKRFTIEAEVMVVKLGIYLLNDLVGLNFIIAAVYFNKIQCFCFEEQLLLPGEQIDMPVFFYIDPEFETDPRMDGINNLVLSYTFFKVKQE
ncbi:hypothetical protein GIB67_005209 [Kingdonia uniflora]|uniref:Uncharacterized protein n=1 Tax=Kingdonia uniflora TaxID=39325 RepID=A0A7J7NMZ7_9MAGN|nr:hypothetical protein GIB67_005209 [Kingdonia uniflora]